MSSPTRWGIASAGNISHDFTNSIIGVLPSHDHQVVAVAARNIEDAKSFAKRHKIEKAYGGYQKLATDPDVEVVYVGAIHPKHLEIAKIYLEAGKSVLCEKPLCMNVKETEELIQLARSKNVFLMEGIWSRCIPAYKVVFHFSKGRIITLSTMKAVQQSIEGGEIGEVKQVVATFGFANEGDRFHKKEMGGGSILDLGIYPIQLAQLVFGGEMPRVLSAGHLGPGGCDDNSSITLVYSRGRTASLVTHSRVQMPNEAFIIGTKGTLKLVKFWTAIEMVHADGRTEKFPLPTGSKHPFNYINSANFAFEAEHVRQCLVSGAKESNLLSLDETLTIAKIMEDARKQIGVKYPQDE